MKLLLTETTRSAKAPGKTILLGEHAAVYGYPAIAVALPDVTLKIEMLAASSGLPQSWEQAWQLDVGGSPQILDQELRDRLTRCLEIAMSLCFPQKNLRDFCPQHINITSHIPLGAGMGGSAALSVAMLRLLNRFEGCQIISAEQMADAANKLDNVFHGSASGLDVSTILSEGIVRFSKTTGPIPVTCGRSFWLVLIDSGTRAETIRMVEHVAQLRQHNPETVEGFLKDLGNLTLTGLDQLTAGALNDFGRSLSQAHAVLQKLEVSLPVLDHIVSELLAMGALGAKLTGAGGGGMVLGIFSENPVNRLEEFAHLGNFFLTSVAASAEK